jgi:hypothetical protein
MPCEKKWHKPKEKQHHLTYDGSVGKYATLEKVMGKNKVVMLEKNKGYVDIYVPKSVNTYSCPRKSCPFTSKTRKEMFAHIRKTGHGSYEESVPKRTSKFLR